MGLVLSRRIDQSFWVGDAEVRVIGFRWGRVELLITAPQEVSVDRDEVRQRKILEQQEMMRDHDDE